MLTLLGTVLTLRAWIVWGAVTSALLTVAPSVVGERQYTSRFGFSAVRKGKANLSGIAAQFGVNLGSNDGDQTPQFFADLATGQQVLSGVLDAMVDSAGGVPRTVLDQLAPTGSTSAERREQGLRLLRRVISVSTSLKTGVTTASVTLRDAALSQRVATAWFASLNSVNLSLRQSQASADRRFTERRAADVRAELQQAEDRLQRFAVQNTGFERSPELRVQYDRLQREVLTRTQVYVSLMQAVEQAKLEEVRDTPVLTLVEPPVAPVYPDPRGLVQRGLLALLVGSVLGLACGLVRPALRGEALSVPDSPEALRTAWITMWRRKGPQA